ncbi:MAG: MarR family transcriptional regulator [Candidatus Bathyarchaeota archaeon]|nr:MarR family transcriptional regulator [Candidatus Bathyarchaeota archaeon]
MVDASTRGKMDQMLDDIYNVIPLFHRTILRPDTPSHNPMGSDFKVMGILMRHGPLPMSRIGVWLGISKPNMTAIINKLIAEGRVERRQDLKDRRIVEVGLTAEGRKYMEDSWKEARESIRTKLSALSEEERDTLYTSLENIRITLSKLSEMRKQ